MNNEEYKKLYRELVTVKCAKCGKRVGVFFYFCPSCGKKLPLSERRRTEIRNVMKKPKAEQFKQTL